MLGGGTRSHQFSQRPLRKNTYVQVAQEWFAWPPEISELIISFPTFKAKPVYLPHRPPRISLIRIFYRCHVWQLPWASGDD